MPVTTPAARAAAPPHPPSATAVPQDFGALARQDPEIGGILLAEAGRQSSTLQLIAAENFTSPAVLAALGSPLANKYAEGYPGARHHGGCEQADAAERVAVRRAMSLFGAEHANVQPHSGSSAVLAAYAALLRPGDTVLAMGLPYGGHLTHGAPGNFSGRWFEFAGYGVDPDSGLVDYAQVRALARARRPKAIVCGSISYPRHLDYEQFRDIADEAGAYLIADAAHPMGLIAGGAAPSPVPYADVVCATTHKVLRGPRGGMILCGVELSERIDRAVFPFTQGGAQMHTVAAKAVAFGEAATPAYAVYAHRVVDRARVLAAALEGEGFEITTGGTDTHIVVADPGPLGVDGRTARERLMAAGMVLDTCALPYGDARGIRLGTAAVTTQGMDEDDMARIAALFGAAVREERDPAVLRAEVRALAERNPPYPG
ncbi:MAG TPA: serine hydroxymethyltransferase [Streptomyces sp.]|uniref:serine hydroxymethyltransferase n=1 Tax=Streptomyces sp. TaxID=1931 RepID=UPI002BE10B5B|nr:serine hydroxymethyltransferase [Streptomyces sp.]HWU06306.1 serine hydroxymethyltransferase [Streptomyces sp.]